MARATQLLLALVLLLNVLTGVSLASPLISSQFAVDGFYIQPSLVNASSSLLDDIRADTERLLLAHRQGAQLADVDRRPVNQLYFDLTGSCVAADPRRAPSTAIDELMAAAARLAGRALGVVDVDAASSSSSPSSSSIVLAWARVLAVPGVSGIRTDSTPWHRDYGAPDFMLHPRNRRNGARVHVALYDDAALQLVAGSHRRPSSVAETLLLDEEAHRHVPGALTMRLAGGDAVVWDESTIHRGRHPRAGWRAPGRRLYQLQFTAVDGGVPSPEFFGKDTPTAAVLADECIEHLPPWMKANALRLRELLANVSKYERQSIFEVALPTRTPIETPTSSAGDDDVCASTGGDADDDDDDTDDDDDDDGDTHSQRAAAASSPSMCFAHAHLTTSGGSSVVDSIHFDGPSPPRRLSVSAVSATFVSLRYSAPAARSIRTAIMCANGTEWIGGAWRNTHVPASRSSVLKRAHFFAVFMPTTTPRQCELIAYTVGDSEHGDEERKALTRIDIEIVE